MIGIGPTPILLHITPYGPSICDVMPYYAVLEYETSFDRRNKWSEFVSKVSISLHNLSICLSCFTLTSLLVI